VVIIPLLETGRLSLRGFRNEDFERYATIWTEPAVVRFIGGTALSREAAWSRFLRQTGHWDRLGFGFFAIEDRATGAFVGEAGFRISAALLPPRSRERWKRGGYERRTGMAKEPRRKPGAPALIGHTEHWSGG